MPRADMLWERQSGAGLVLIAIAFSKTTDYMLNLCLSTAQQLIDCDRQSKSILHVQYHWYIPLDSCRSEP